MNCVICATSMIHLFHEPMSMGCKCEERCCQRCFKTGDIRKCPTCRHAKKHPNVDRKLLKREWKAISSQASCLGCEKTMSARHLHKHENKCVLYRNRMDADYQEDIRLRRKQAAETEVSMVEMEARLDLQADMIDDMEEQMEEMETMAKQQEEQRQAYCTEQAKQIRLLDSISGPLYAAIRSLDVLYSRISTQRCSLRSSRAHHQLRRRQSTSTTRFQSLDGPRASPTPSPHQSHPLSLPEPVLVNDSANVSAVNGEDEGEEEEACSNGTDNS